MRRGGTAREQNSPSVPPQPHFMTGRSPAMKSGLFYRVSQGNL